MLSPTQNQSSSDAQDIAVMVDALKNVMGDSGSGMTGGNMTTNDGISQVRCVLEKRIDYSGPNRLRSLLIC